MSLCDCGVILVATPPYVDLEQWLSDGLTTISNATGLACANYHLQRRNRNCKKPGTSGGQTVTCRRECPISPAAKRFPGHKIPSFSARTLQRSSSSPPNKLVVEFNASTIRRPSPPPPSGVDAVTRRSRWFRSSITRERQGTASAPSGAVTQPHRRKAAGAAGMHRMMCQP